MKGNCFPALFSALLLGASFAPAQGLPPEPTSVLKGQLALDADRLVAGRPFRLAVVVRVEPGWHVNSHTPSEDFLIPTSVTLDPVAGIAVKPPVYPPHVERKLGFSEKPVAVYEGTVVVRVDGTVAEDAAPGPRTLRATVEFQPCSDTQCLAPSETSTTLAVDLAPSGTESRPASPELFSAASRNGAPPAPGPGQERSDDRFRGLSLLAIFGLVFLGGLALNLTPCVYPIIPITLGFFGRQTQAKGARPIGLAVLYVLGMSVTYSALGVFAALSGALFGSWLQKPAVLVAIAAVILALALSMFGLFEIRAPHFITDRTGSKGGGLGAFAMGLFVGFVAAPCIGPFIISLLGYVALQKSVLLGFGLFFTLSMGLGLPYLVLGAATSSLQKLPRSGEWMLAVRKVFGFVLLSLAVYFLRPLLAPRVAEIGLAAPLLAGGIWFLFLEKNARSAAWFRWVRIGIAVALLAAGTFLAFPSKRPGLVFQPYSAQALEAARRDGKPVVIDFAASWCAPCRELEEQTFTDPLVLSAAEGWVLLKADVTASASPEVKTLQAKWGVRGVPAVIFLRPDGTEAGPRVVEFEKGERFAARFRR